MPGNVIASRASRASYLSGQGQTPYGGCPGGFEGPGAGVQGGPGGADVVDEKDAVPPEPFVPAEEGSGHIFLPCFNARRPGLGGRIPAAQQATLLHGQAGEARHPPGQETGGIVAPLSPPPGMEGYGHQDITRRAVGPPVIDQELRQGVGRRLEALVFELVNSLPHHPFKTKGGAYAIDGQGPLAAGRTVMGMGLRLAAPGAQDTLQQG